VTEPVAEVGRRAGEAPGTLLVLRKEATTLICTSGNESRKGASLLRRLGELRCEDLVGDLQVSLVDHLLDEAADDLLCDCLARSPVFMAIIVA
jgi:hypothetical protein